MKRQLIFLLLTLLAMGTIFYYSSKDAAESEEDSVEVGMLFGKVFVPGFEKKSEEKQYEYARKIDHPVRKTAHFTEFMILGMLCFGSMLPVKEEREKKKLIKRAFASALVAVTYSATDEFHQTFVPGRAGRLTDVLIDSAGVIFGVSILTLIFLLKVKKESKG